MKRLLVIIVFSLAPILGFSQEPSKSPKREQHWTYDVTIIKDQKGKIVKVEKKVFAKGTPGGPILIRWFETTETRDASGIIRSSTTERIGENNVDPEIVKQYGSQGK